MSFERALLSNQHYYEINMKRKLEDSTSEGQNPKKLIKAIATGDIAEARLLITKMNNEEINATDNDGNTALHNAAYEGSKEVCKLLITISPEAINAVNKDGFTALHIAASKGHKEVCKLLITMSPEAINAVNKDGWTALHTAASNGSKEVCELLITMSPEAINAVNKNGNTALIWVISEGLKEVCQVFINEISIKPLVEAVIETNTSSNTPETLSRILEDFINDKFSVSDTSKISLNFYENKLLKLSQVIDQKLLKVYLNNEQYKINANNYITKNYFKLINVCKSVNEDNPISSLVNSDCMPHMLSYLAPNSLSPELFAQVKMSGEDTEHTLS